MKNQTVAEMLERGIEAHKGETIRIRLSSGYEEEYAIGETCYVQETLDKEDAPAKACIFKIDLNLCMNEGEKPRFATTLLFIDLENREEHGLPKTYHSGYVACWGKSREACMEEAERQRNGIDSED